MHFLNEDDEYKSGSKLIKKLKYLRAYAYKIEMTFWIYVLVAIVVLLILVSGAKHASMPAKVVSSDGTVMANKVLTPPWKCLKLQDNTIGMGTHYNVLKRTPDGHIQCTSVNGKDCHWFANESSCKVFLNGISSLALKPLTCGTGGAGYMSTEWGESGERDHHWCDQKRTDV